MEPTKTVLFEASVAGRVRELLEDFDVTGTLLHLVLVPKAQHDKSLRQNIRAAAVASSLGLRSLDYAKRQYCDDEDDYSQPDPTNAYISAYKVAKSYVLEELAKLRTEGRPDPSVGVFGASLALERLPGSFFCAHLLYRLGHNYEGHSVARLILEQIAWAYVASGLDEIERIAKIDTTHTITELKRFVPEAGRLYGFLSKKTHIDYSTHREFLQHKGGANVVFQAQPMFDDSVRVILMLADLFGIVWELSQWSYIPDPEAVCIGKERLVPNPKRPFIKEMRNYIHGVEEALAVHKAKQQNMGGKDSTN